MSSARVSTGATRLFAWYVSTPVGHKLIAAFIAGAVTGWVMGPSTAVLQPLGNLFIGLLRVLVLPIVVSTILAGLSSTAAQLAAQAAVRVVLVYLVTALAASAAGVTAAALLQPGANLLLPGDEPFVPAGGGGGPGILTGQSVAENNLVRALGNGGLMPVTLVSIALALALGAVRGKLQPGRLAMVDRALDRFVRAVYWVLGVVMQYAPIGTFALIAVTFGRREEALAEHLARVFASVYLGQAAVVAGLLLALVAASVPVRGFLLRVKAPLLTAFATGSSAAALPVEIESAGQQLRLDRGLVGFALPLGAAINKTGTAVHLAVIAAFASNVSGHGMSVDQTAAVTVAAFTAALVTPPISGGSYVVMAGMLQDLGLPLGVIGVVAGIPFLGKLNTPVNSLGRLVATRLVAGRYRTAPAAPDGVVATAAP